MDPFRASDRVEQACGVIAARLDLDPETAAELLCGVALRTGRSTDELAAEVLALPKTSQVTLPLDLHRNHHGYDPAA
jgi:ANTAR domain